jgi:hypothetical protein
MKKLLVITMFLSSFLLNSCDILDQAQQAMAFTKCEFRLGTLTNTQLAGVNIHNKNSYRDLNALDIARVGTAYAAGSLPLSFTLNVDIKNPNTRAAGMSKLDWILLIDGVERLTGVTEERITIPANGGTATMPMNLKFDLMKVVEAKNLESLANFAMNLAGVGNRPSRVTLKAKPTVYVGTTPISYPNYITIENEFSSN